ncbi:hypothetical protein AALA78_11860 [Lachnospiraceae bacterium 42-17]|jgi:hypothetical protein|nr:hypothetical protein [Dorea sp.]
MKRRLLSLCCIILLVFGLVSGTVIDSQAAEEQSVIDGSYLTEDEESVGYDTKITRGEDLLTGYSKCVVMGPGKLYAGGCTIATRTVKDVGLSVSIERAQKGDDRWTGYTAWQKFNENVDRVASSKMLEVEGGYYYRVRCTHSANSDLSSSFTDGVFVEKP